jgi:tRNA(fMet)-specific endonuclease VapC
MTFLLDTNVCIGYLNGRAPGVLHRLQSIPVTDIVVCSVVKAELYFGARASLHPEQTLGKQQSFLELFTSLPFDDSAAEAYGRIRAQLRTLGTPIGPNDLMIAAIAVANNVTLVSHNTNEFSRVDGLGLEDWQAEE